MSTAMPQDQVEVTAEGLARRLGALPVDAGLLEAARAAGRTRAIDYVLGSGEAEQVALIAGYKPLVRQIVAAGEVAAIERRMASLGVVVVTAAGSSSTAARAVPGARVIFAGRDRRRAQAAAELEGRAEHDLEMARLLGYPRCCAEAYLDEPPPRENARVLAATLARTAGGVGAARLNCLDGGVFHYVGWLPCSFACAPSLRYADAVAAVIRRRHGQWVEGRGARATPSCPAGCKHERFVDAIDTALGASRLLALEGVQVSIEGTREGGGVRVERAWPTVRDRHPEVVASEVEIEAAARLAALCVQAGSVRVDEGVVVLGGVPVARAPDAMLVPFGAG